MPRTRQKEQAYGVPDDEMPELTADDFVRRGIRGDIRRRLMRRDYKGGEDALALRTWLGQTQAQFAETLGIRLFTLRGWEQSQRRPEGPARALLAVVATHPHLFSKRRTPPKEEAGIVHFEAQAQRRARSSRA